MNELQKLLENAGVTENVKIVVEGQKFANAGEMAKFIVGRIIQIRDDNLHPDVEAEDILSDLNDLLEIIADSTVNPSRRDPRTVYK